MKRAAIIGCGTIFQVHLPIIVANPEIELCACLLYTSDAADEL